LDAARLVDNLLLSLTDRFEAFFEGVSKAALALWSSSSEV